MTMKISCGIASIAALLLSACGGGGGQSNSEAAPNGGSSNPAPGGGSTPGGGIGGANAATFKVSPSTLSFAAPMPSAAAPQPQTVVATVEGQLSGTLYVLVQSTGPAVANISDVAVTSGTTGQASVTPAHPSTLGPGVSNSVITVTACVNDPTCATGRLNGSPQTINVSYDVASNVQTDVVAPYAVPASTSGEVVLRGHGLQSAASVSFGGVAALNVTVVSDTEVHATYPALSAGVYAVRINDGALSFAGSLVATPTTSYAYQRLDYPQGVDTTALSMRGFVYDAERQALVVAMNQPQTGNNQLVRYAYTGAAWSAPSTKVVPELRSIALTADGARIIALTNNGVTELAASDLSTLGTYAGPYSANEASRYHLKDLAVANDGNVLVTTGILNGGSGDTELFVYSTTKHTFLEVDPRVLYPYFATPTASANGSRVVLLQGSLTPPRAVPQYLASNGVIVENAARFNQHLSPASVSRSGDRFVVTGNATNALVFSSNGSRLGALPADVLAAALSPDGTRVYTYNAAVQFRVFDLSVVMDPFPQVSSITLADNPRTTGSPDRIRMLTTLDGRAVFLAGSSHVVVQPAL